MATANPNLSAEDLAKQAHYRDARSSNKYDDIWQSVNKCVFCDLKEKYIFFEENGIVMTINIFAYIDGHFMIIPRRHARSVQDLTQLEWDTIRKFLYIAKKMIKDVHGIRGMQLVQKDGEVAQSTVGHIHFHCIPFDAPDLCTWNTRKLKNTPLENVALYKADAKKIVAYDTKFSKKYSNFTSLPVICDLVVINDRREVMLQERNPMVQLIPNYLTLPGGGVDDYSQRFETELQREVREETGYNLDISKLMLVDSRVGSTNRRSISRQLGLAFSQAKQFVWNTYAVFDVPSDVKLTPGDDCQDIVWVGLDELADHPRISPEIREAVEKAVATQND